jgi:hypothetical protein
MSKSDLAHISVADFVERFRAEMVPYSNTFSYFFAGLPLTEDDVKDYLGDPISAIPPSITRGSPKASIILGPFLERANGRTKRHRAAPPGSFEFICIERPPENKACTHLAFRTSHGAHLLFAVKDTELADYHHRFYHQVASLVESELPDDIRGEYHVLLREELSAHVHGEVDDQSWHFKQTLRRRGANVRRDTKAFREYGQYSFVDTLTLYLHGICCDIDVETGPRQLPSRFLRKRLVWMESVYPPPSGYAVFPEELETGGKAEGQA